MISRKDLLVRICLYTPAASIKKEVSEKPEIHMRETGTGMMLGAEEDSVMSVVVKMLYFPSTPLIFLHSDLL